MLGYPSLGDRETSWAAFQADPDWQRARLGNPADGFNCRAAIAWRMQDYLELGEFVAAAAAQGP
jgi:hypothetical protein